MKLTVPIALLLAIALTTACSQAGVKLAGGDAKPVQAAGGAPPAEAPPQTEAALELPHVELTPDLLFRFLVAEVAGQRGAVHIAQATYLDLAHETRDPRVARRATEIALFTRNQPAALSAARLWMDTEPGSLRARQTLATLLLNEGRLDEAEPYLRAMVSEAPVGVFLHMTVLTGKATDVAGVHALVSRVAQDYPTLPEAQYAVAQAAQAASKLNEALAALDAADRLRPGWEAASLLRAQVLARLSQAESLAFMRTQLQRHPDLRELRLAYARALVGANRFAEAQPEFDRLARELPQSAEIALAAGLVTLQLGDAAAAREQLLRAEALESRNADTTQYYLGQAHEQLRDPAAARGHYARVGEGEYLVPARIRLAALMARAGEVEAAATLVRETRGQNDAQAIRLVQAEGEILRNARQYQAAFEALSRGLEKFPDSPELLYDRAMAAEKIDRLDILEADLRKLIRIKPDDAHAYNALGYTLADRTPRIAEAIELLERALALAPEDAFILDSVGWAQYRAGNLERAQSYLERAFAKRPDPEIAAHLGEVLWMRGQREAAGRIWNDSLGAHPDNEVLLETLRRLRP